MSGKSTTKLNDEPPIGNHSLKNHQLPIVKLISSYKLQSLFLTRIDTYSRNWFAFFVLRVLPKITISELSECLIHLHGILHSIISELGKESANHYQGIL